jgi:hypothetical protein
MFKDQDLQEDLQSHKIYSCKIIMIIMLIMKFCTKDIAR